MRCMREVVIVDGVRTAVGRKGGALSHYRSDDLAAVVLTELMTRTNVNKREVEDIILGCVTQVNEQGGNIARTAALIAGFPIHVPGLRLTDNVDPANKLFISERKQLPQVIWTWSLLVE